MASDCRKHTQLGSRNDVHHSDWMKSGCGGPRDDMQHLERPYHGRLAFPMDSRSTLRSTYRMPARKQASKQNPTWPTRTAERQRTCIDGLCGVAMPASIHVHYASGWYCAGRKVERCNQTNKQHQTNNRSSQRNRMHRGVTTPTTKGVHSSGGVTREKSRTH
jgi:hypothetical protein